MSLIAKRMNKTYRVPLLYDGTGGGSLLPPELQACEYLETDGSAWIRTNLFFDSSSMNFYAKFDIPNGSSFGVFGARGTNTTDTFSSNIGNNQGCVFDCGRTQNNRIEVNNAYKNLIYKYEDFTTQIINYNNDELLASQYIIETQRGNIGRRLCIFACNTGGNISNIKSGLRCRQFYSLNNINMINCYIIDNNTFIDNKGIECPAGTPGMYDTINNLFYTNDGTGNFTHGPDINI